MAPITWPITPDGLGLAVLVGPNGQAMASLLAAGQSITAPVWARALIDTGTNVTCVAAQLLHALGLTPFSQASSQTASGLVGVNLFQVSLSVPLPQAPSGTLLSRPNLIVMELADPIPGVDVLIGLDILLDGTLVVDGPGRRFTLAF